MKKKKKREKWLKFRHRVVRNILSFTLGIYSKHKYGIKVEKFRDQEKRPYLILMNHQTAHDQFFVGMAFKGPVYYLASEDIFSMGRISSLIRYLVAPIPIKKQTTDVKAIMTCIRVAKEGGTIAIAPEGNRTYSGKTEYMSPTIAPLARKLGMPIALFRIEGGYGVHPRWSDVVRQGKMRAYVSRVISPEEYGNMTDDELFSVIERELYVNEAVADASFKHKKRAEYLERALYTCPHCGIARLESHESKIVCTSCARTVEYTEKKELIGENFELPFRFVCDWYEWQKEYVNSLDTCALISKPISEDTVELLKVIPYKKKETIAKKAKISLYGDRIELSYNDTTRTFSFDEASAVTVLGKNKLDIYYGDEIYQISPPERFSGLMYVHIFNRYQNIKKGNLNGTFLGL